MIRGRVSVIIVSYGTRELTLSAVRSALTCSAVRDAVVVDNASRDGSTEALSATGNHRVTVLANDSNVGFGRAANRGASVAGGDVLFFLNSDAELTNEACDALLAELDSYGGRAIVGPALQSIDGSLQRSVGLRPAPADLILRALGLHRFGTWLAERPMLGQLVRATRIATEYGTAESATRPVDTSMVSGACFAIGREAFRELGGFDERFFMYFEDADLCRRALEAGMAVRYVPTATVTHIGGASSNQDYHFGPLHARSMRQYLGKWWGPPGSMLAVILLWLRAIGFSAGLRPEAGRAWRALGAAVKP